ncbi:MAG: RNA methyltransferase [Desulfobulbaceae bacterium]|nr:RNA methyltransferase [Desulfobulbaceae bacterium]
MDVALVHYPVHNRNGEVIGSAVTNLDLHDIARASRTFGVDSYYVVTPFADQQQLAREIVDHWLTGYGSERNPPRREALSLIRICTDLAEVYAAATAKWGQRPTILATSAVPGGKVAAYARVRERIASGEAFLILFGTGWGLTAAALADADAQLPPLKGGGDYNHLSVRSAAAIVLDRLLGVS